MSEKNSDNGSETRELPAFQVKCALINAKAELTKAGVKLTVEDTRKLGKAAEIVTGQRWYGFINKMLSGAFDNWERKAYGHKLGKGIAGMYNKLAA